MISINKNLEFIISETVDGDHWEPNWNWSDSYPEDWEIAKNEWRGNLTVNNLLTLRKFGAIDLL